MRRLLLLLVATVWLLTGTASATTPADPRITAAVAAWATQPLYVDPDYSSVADRAETLQVISGAKVPVYVAVVPFGEWFPEQGDIPMLAGRMAAANGKPGLYVVMDGDRSYGAAHQLGVYAPSWTYAERDESLSKQLSEYLDGTLGESDRRRLESHLVACSPCTAYLNTLRATVRALGKLKPPRAPQSARSRIVEQARRESDATS